jgi:hypothetical protein
VWQNGVLTSNPVELGHWTMREVADQQQQALENKAHVEAAVLEKRRVTE